MGLNRYLLGLASAGPMTYPPQRGTHRAGPTLYQLTMRDPPSSPHLEQSRFPRARARPPLPPLFPILPLLSGDEPRQPEMSTSSDSRTRWPQYGPVPLVKCYRCGRPDPVKRFVSKTNENGNLGRHFVKCLSKPTIGPDGKVRSHFFRSRLI